MMTDRPPHDGIQRPKLAERYCRSCGLRLPKDRIGKTRLCARCERTEKGILEEMTDDG